MRRINLGPTNKKTQATWIQWITDALRNIERWINTITAFKGATASADGSDGIVPQPRAGDQTKFLKADGTWATPAGAGNVTKVGTPVDNQIGVWTGDGTIEGDAALTFDTTTDTLAIAATGNLAFGAVTVLDDNAGTMTLSNVDALDATTEATIEAAIDTAANLTSVQGKTVTLEDNNLDQVMFWDDSAGAWINATLARLTTEASPSAGDYFLVQRAEDDVVKVNWSSLPGGIGGSTGSVDNALVRADGTGGATVQAGALATLSDTGDFEITSTSAGAIGPQFSFYYDSATPAYEQRLGVINFYGADSLGNKTLYGSLAGNIVIANDGLESGGFQIDLVAAGAASAPIYDFQINNFSAKVSGVDVGNGSVPFDVCFLNSIELGHASDTTVSRVSAGDITIEGNAVYRAGGTDVALADGGTGASLADPGVDRIMFWDDSAGAVDWLTIGTNLTITGTTLDATAGSATAASQAEQEAGSSTTVFTTPGRQHFHPGHPKCWAFWTVSAGTPTLESSYNITSIADTAVGRVTVTIATDFSSANWLPVPSTATNSTGNGGGDFCAYASIAAGSVEIQSRNLAGATNIDQSLADNASYGFAGFGDHA